MLVMISEKKHPNEDFNVITLDFDNPVDFHRI